MKKTSSLRNDVLQRIIQELIINSKNLNQIKSAQKIQVEDQEKKESPQVEDQTPETDNLDKLISILEEDSEIEKMECPGPDKPIILVKNGIIVQTPLSLTKEEIEKTITKVAQETDNEDQEIINAILGEWSFNGIRSEFGGSRFIIERAA